MKTERKIEILEQVKYIIKNDRLRVICGMCGVLESLYDRKRILKREWLGIEKILSDNRPTPDNQYAEFTQNEYWKKNYLSLKSSFWWQTIHNEPKTRKIRVDYLTKLIENLK